MPRILLIEDEPALRLTFRHILEGNGHEVQDAENGRVGLELCRQNRPDLVITDVVMPELSGEEALSILFQEFPDLPIIAMSGMEDALSVATLAERDFLCCVMKPVNSADLLHLVEEMLAKTPQDRRPPLHRSQPV